MKMRKDAVIKAGDGRPAGYVEDVLSHCKDLGDGWLKISPFDHAKLAEKYSAHPGYAKLPGPGAQLKALLAKFGIHASPTCGCNAMARKMDAWGPDESLKHIEEIVDVMEETAKKRNLPFIRSAGRLLVRRAISKSRAMVSKGSQ